MFLYKKALDIETLLFSFEHSLEINLDFYFKRAFTIYVNWWVDLHFAYLMHYFYPLKDFLNLDVF